MAVDVHRGADPIRDSRVRRASAKAPTGQTFATLLDLYGEQVGSTVKSWRAMRRQIERVFSKLLSEPLGALSIGALQLAADSYPAKQSASHAVGCIKPVLKWASAPGRAYLGRDLVDLRQPAGKRRRDRVLSRDELRLLLPAMRASESPYAKAMRLISMTLVRREEVAVARWRDVDFRAGTWTLPKTKNRQPHVIPLPKQALELLRSLGAHNPEPDALIFSTARGKALSAWSYATEQLQERSGTSGWTRHDLRRTGATMMGEMSIPPATVEAALNHVTIHSQIAATYNRSRYRNEVQAALQRLADALDGIEHGGAEVIALPATR
jgi:integrase